MGNFENRGNLQKKLNIILNTQEKTVFNILVFLVFHHVPELDLPHQCLSILLLEYSFIFTIKNNYNEYPCL